MVFDPNIGKRTRWQRGQASPNPGGRPKSRTISEALREKLASVKDDDPQRRTYAQVLAENLVSLACSQERNSVAAAVEIANRVEGRVHERIEFSDITTELGNKSDEELRFYLAHDRWPSTEELLLLKQPVEPTEM